MTVVTTKQELKLFETVSNEYIGTEYSLQTTVEGIGYMRCMHDIGLISDEMFQMYIDVAFTDIKQKTLERLTPIV